MKLMKKMAKFTPFAFLMLLLLELGLLSLAKNPVTAMASTLVAFALFLVGVMLAMSYACCFFQVVHRAMQKHDTGALRNLFFEWVALSLAIFVIDHLTGKAVLGVGQCMLYGVLCTVIAQAGANAWRRDENDR